MSPNHGCLAVGTGGHLPGHMQPAPPDIKTRLFSHPGWWVCHLAQGNLEALWEGPLGGAFMRMGAIGWKPGKDVFPPVSMPGRLFAGDVIGYTLQKTLLAML